MFLITVMHIFMLKNTPGAYTVCKNILIMTKYDEYLCSHVALRRLKQTHADKCGYSTATSASRSIINPRRSPCLFLHLAGSSVPEECFQITGSVL